MSLSFASCTSHGLGLALKTFGLDLGSSGLDYKTASYYKQQHSLASHDLININH